MNPKKVLHIINYQSNSLKKQSSKFEILHKPSFTRTECEKNLTVSIISTHQAMDKLVKKK